MNFQAGRPLYDLGQIYVVIMLLRAVFSFFPYSPDSPLNPVRRFCHLVTEPVIAPFRRIIPQVGMLDLSYLAAFIVVELVVQLVLIRIP